MNMLAEREKVRFISGDTRCAAWHYPGTNGACVIVAGGGGGHEQAVEAELSFLRRHLPDHPPADRPALEESALHQGGQA